MLQAYSVNIAVDADSFVPLQNVSIKKGCSEALSGVSAINLNRCGVYRVTVDASAEPGTAGLISLDLYRDGVAMPQAQSSVTGATDAVSTLGFETYVQVQTNNSCRCCDRATTIQLYNSGVDVTFLNVNVTVDKIC